MASFFAALRRLFRFLGLGRSEPAAHAAAAPPPPPPVATPNLGVARPAPIPVTQAMTQLVAVNGVYPAHDAGGNACFTLGMVQTFAGFSSVYGTSRAQGQTLPLNVNQALFSLFGANFGGDLPTSFGLPNLNGRVAIGGHQVGMSGQGTLAMTWLIATGPSQVAPVPGMIAMFGGNYAPDGWALCDGSLLPISQHIPLFEAIGTAFGGDHVSNFALPDFSGGAAPIGAGQGPGRAPVALGQKVAGPIAGLGVNYLIAVEGPSPPSSGDGAFPETGQFLGQVIAYAGAQPPAGWALCDGSLLQVGPSQMLFELIGTSYGGDGQSTFALPDLRGRMVTGLAA